MTASDILVVILAIALAVFLVLAIVLTSYLIVIAKKIRNVANVAERTANNFENIVATVQKAAAPAVVSRFILEHIARFTDRHKKDDN